MLRFFQAMMPREEKFFALFDRHAQTLVAGAVDGVEVERDQPRTFRRRACRTPP